MPLTEDTLVIERSQGKMLLMVGALALFGALSLWLLLLDEAAIRTLRPGSNPTWVHSIGGAGVVLSALGLIYGVVKLFDRRPGLVLSPQGITDHSSAVAAGLIPWSDVTGFSIFQVHRTRLMIILVRNPEDYARRGGALKRAVHRTNIRMVGSPLSISSNVLKIDFDRLHQQLESWRARFAPA